MRCTPSFHTVAKPKSIENQKYSSQIVRPQRSHPELNYPMGSHMGSYIVNFLRGYLKKNFYSRWENTLHRLN